MSAFRSRVGRIVRLVNGLSRPSSCKIVMTPLSNLIVGCSSTKDSKNAMRGARTKRTNSVQSSLSLHTSGKTARPKAASCCFRGVPRPFSAAPYTRRPCVAVGRRRSTCARLQSYASSVAP